MSDFDELNKNENSQVNETDNAASSPEIQSAETVSGVETVTKHKKGPVIAAVVAGVVAVGAGGTAIAYNTSDYVKNQVKLATLSPDEYYSWVNEENSKTSIKKLSEAYGEALSYMGPDAKKSVSQNMELKYTATDDVKELLLSSVFGADYANSAQQSGQQQYVDIIKNIKDITLGLNSSMSKGVSNESIYAALNGDKLMSFEAVSDMTALTYFMRIPELSEKYVGLDMEKAMGEASSDGTYAKMMDIFKNPAEYLSQEDMEKLLTKYSAIWYNTVEDVELEKKEKVEIGDIETEYTVLTVDVDKKLAEKLATNYINAISKDDFIKQLVTEKLKACTADEYDSALSDALDEIKNSNDAEDAKGEILTYVDAKGQIRGYSCNFDEDGENQQVSYMIGKEDDKVCGKLNVDVDDTAFGAVLNAKEDKKDVYNGEIDITVNTPSYSDDEDNDSTEKKEYTVEFKNFEIVDAKKCYVNGDVTVVIPDVSPFSFKLSTDGKSQELNFDINVNDVNYGNINLTFSSDENGEATAPNADEAFMIDPKSSVDFSKYVSEADFIKFASSVIQKVGFNSNDAQMFAQSIASSIYSSSGSSIPDYSGGADNSDDYPYQDTTYDTQITTSNLKIQ
ncbi:MAG: hypothetical protein LKG21_07125 [Ruminococcus sp.]|jgi:hypothetical protein|nr:hypothetical protein [Ruminococcus sp.]